MKNLACLVAVALVVAQTSLISASFTWVGSTSDLSLDTNWNPTVDAPPTGFADDDAIFNSTATTFTGLTPNGAPFYVRNLSFSGGAYSFASSGPGDSISIGSNGNGTLSVTAGSVNFNNQSVNLNNPMTWVVSGGSTTILSSGTVNASNLALGLSFGVSQQNVVTLSSLVLGTSGALTVNNWGGSMGVFGGSNNQLRFSSDPSALLSKISFTGYAGAASTQNMGSYWEVAPVPEPTTWGLLVGGLTALMIFRRRRHA